MKKPILISSLRVITKQSSWFGVGHWIASLRSQRRVALALGLSFLCAIGHASEAELNTTLVRIINQLNAVLPLLNEAEEEIEPNARIHLHINSFIGADGTKHPGVRDDLKSIRNVLIDYINKPAIEPKTVKPLAFDFIGK